MKRKISKFLAVSILMISGIFISIAPISASCHMDTFPCPNGFEEGWVCVNTGGGSILCHCGTEYMC